jgi:hypothetical protein
VRLAVAALGLSALAPAASGAGEAMTLAAADHATRAVLIDLGLPESPAPTDYEVAARTLALIAELSPLDAEIARLETAAAFGTGNPRLLAAATSRVVRLDPADTVAQLRLITARIAERQTAEERLEVYARLLGPRGVSIDPTVRSRLALDAALIHRERGDIDGFVRELSRAIELDRTNKEAQHLATSYFAGLSSDDADGKAGLLEMQLNLMWADPVDPNIYLSIARMLAVEGATQQALRFHSIGVSILAQAGQLDQKNQVETLALQWLTAGPQPVLAQIDQDLRVMRDLARMRYEEDLQRDIPDRLLTPPEEVFLDPLFEKIRVIAAMDAMDSEALRTGLRELDANAAFQLRQMEEALALRDEESRREAFEAFAVTVVESQFMRVLANVEVEQLAALMPQLPKFIGEEKWERFRRPLTAWVALRTGDLERARALLRELGTAASEMQILQAELLVAEGRSTEAAAVYDRILRQRAFIPFGAWARSRAMELTGRTDPVTEAGRRMRRMAEEVPGALDSIVRDAASAIALNIVPTEEVYAPGERAELRVSLANTTPWPLSLGSNRTISSRVLLGVLVDNAEELASPPQPMIIDLDRRFRLEPGETLEVTARVERGLNGLIFDASGRGQIRQRWQGWQSPALGPDGAYRAGPFSLSDSTVKFTRATRDETRLPDAAIAELVRNAEGDDAVAAIESAAARLWRGSPADPVGIADEAAIVSALTARYDGAGGAERALLLAALPSASQVASMAPFDEHVRRGVSLEAVRRIETPRVVAALLLLTRVTDPDSPLLDAARGSDDAGLSRLAAALEGRLREGGPALATAGPGIDGLAGSTKTSLLRGSADP